jgi:hypothetical protein
MVTAARLPCPSSHFKEKKRKFVTAATQPIRVYMMHSDDVVAVHDPRITV